MFEESHDEKAILEDCPPEIRHDKELLSAFYSGIKEGYITAEKKYRMDGGNTEDMTTLLVNYFNHFRDNTLAVFKQTPNPRTKENVYDMAGFLLGFVEGGLEWGILGITKIANTPALASNYKARIASLIQTLKIELNYPRFKHLKKNIGQIALKYSRNPVAHTFMLEIANLF